MFPFSFIIIIITTKQVFLLWLSFWLHDPCCCHVCFMSCIRLWSTSCCSLIKLNLVIINLIVYKWEQYCFLHWTVLLLLWNRIINTSLTFLSNVYFTVIVQQLNCIDWLTLEIVKNPQLIKKNSVDIKCNIVSPFVYDILLIILPSINIEVS